MRMFFPLPDPVHSKNAMMNQATTMHLILTFASLFILLAPSNASADDLLTKSFVSRMFSTSFSEWSESLTDSHAMGDAKVAVNGTYSWTQLTLTPIGILKVTPDYARQYLNRPKRLDVSLQENQARGKKTLQLTDAELLELISSLQKEMLPEYSLTTTIDLVGGVSQYHFTLYEVGEYPQLDRVSKDTNGCWQRCIRR
jgi:hypothetical protein